MEFPASSALPLGLRKLGEPHPSWHFYPGFSELCSWPQLTSSYFRMLSHVPGLLI